MGSVTQRRFDAMGTWVHVVALGGPGHLTELAERSIRAAEARLSRFRPDSELSVLNASPGRPVMVSPATYDLIELACRASAGTGGRFDPTVHDALVAAGYDRSFDQLATVSGRTTACAPSPGLAGVDLDPVAGCVTLAPGTKLDLGGVAKGHTADVVASELVEAGAAGCCVNIGGDLRVTGDPPDAAGWTVELRGHGAPTGVVVALADGAVCTSTRLRRTWASADGPAHHLIDPRTGRPTASGVATASIVSSTAAQGEVLAKAAFVAGWPDAAPLLADHGVTGLIVTDDDVVHRLAGLDRFDRDALAVTR